LNTTNKKLLDGEKMDEEYELTDLEQTLLDIEEKFRALKESLDNARKFREYNDIFRNTLIDIEDIEVKFIDAGHKRNNSFEWRIIN
jgi:hypothetical protein